MGFLCDINVTFILYWFLNVTLALFRATLLRKGSECSFIIPTCRGFATQTGGLEADRIGWVLIKV